MTEARADIPSFHNHPLDELGHRVRDVMSFAKRHYKEAAVSVALPMAALGAGYFLIHPDENRPNPLSLRNSNSSANAPLNLEGAIPSLRPMNQEEIKATYTLTATSTPTMELFTNPHHNTKDDEGKFPPTATPTSTPTSTEKPKPTTTSTPKPPTPEAHQHQPTNIIINNAILIDNSPVSNEKKAHANALVKMAEETLKETGLKGLIDTIEIVDPRNPRLTIGSEGYGKSIDESMAQGEFRARFFPEERLIVLSNNPDLALLNSKYALTHDLSHALDLRYNLLDRLLSPQEKKQLEDKYQKALAEYKQKTFIEGHPYSLLEARIQYGLFAELGQKLKADFVQAIGHPEYLNMGIPRETLEQAAKTQKDPLILLIINNFLKDPNNPDLTSYMTNVGLGKEIVRAYCLDKASFSKLPPQQQAEIVKAVNKIIESSQIEGWAEIGQDILAGKEGVKTNYPGVYEAFDSTLKVVREN